jgi:2-oxoisovalerate dehydrogenase E1 component
MTETARIDPDLSADEAFDIAELREMHRRMLRIRRFEERAGEMYRDGEIPGFVHLSVGQEATAVGACWPLRRDDYITSTHRGHGHLLAKDADMTAMFAELLGREDGTCHGRGGSMHIAEPSLGVLGANGIVAAGLPIAVGAAWWAKMRSSGQVTISFFGDGAVAHGAFHEAVNLAALRHLPLIFLCENNQFAEFSAAADQHPVPVVQRAAGYGIEGISMPGNDIATVARTMLSLVDRCRGGEGPFLVEALTYRRRGHYEGDPQRYRDAAGLEEWESRDPLLSSAETLVRRGVATAELVEMQARVEQEVEDAIADARRSPEPDPARLSDFVIVPRDVPPAAPSPSRDDEDVCRVLDALNSALADELEDDPSVFLAGIDVAGGNVFTITRGLRDRWPERVLDMPICETAIVGTGIGAALAGARPVIEVMYVDFIGVCLDQIMNQAAKLHYMTGGKATVPLTIRTQFGAGKSSAAQHSQSLESLLCHIPGLTVVMPSTPADAYGLLRAAIQDPNPVVFIEHRLLYGTKGPRPPRDHVLPLGKAAVVRPGRDVTVVAASKMVYDALAAAEILADQEIEVEVIDLRTVCPLDLDTILESVARTNRLLVAHEAVRDFGIGAEIASAIGEEGFWNLDAPISRVGAPFTPAPYAPSLEGGWIVGVDEIVEKLQDLVVI